MITNELNQDLFNIDMDALRVELEQYEQELEKENQQVQVDLFSNTYEISYLNLSAVNVLTMDKETLCLIIALNPDEHFKLFFDDMLIFNDHIRIKSNKLLEDKSISAEVKTEINNIVTDFNDKMNYLKEHFSELSVNRNLISLGSKVGGNQDISWYLQLSNYEALMDRLTIYPEKKTNIKSALTALNTYKHFAFCIENVVAFRGIYKEYIKGTNADDIKSQFEVEQVDNFFKLVEVQTTNHTYTAEQHEALKLLDFPYYIAGNESYVLEDFLQVLNTDTYVGDLPRDRYKTQVAELTNKVKQLEAANKVSYPDALFF